MKCAKCRYSRKIEGTYYLYECRKLSFRYVAIVNYQKDCEFFRKKGIIGLFDDIRAILRNLKRWKNGTK